MKQLLLILVCLASVSMAGAKSISLSFGPYAADKQNLPIVVSLSDYPAFSAADRQRLGVWVDGQEIASQLDDLDGDGQPDELAFLLSLPAGKTKQIVIRPTRRHASFPREVYAEMYLKSKTPKEGYIPWTAEGKSFYITPVTEQSFGPGEDSYHSMHHHGVAFESALMAYRIYFDQKQTIDLYAKKTPRLEIEECKWYPTDEQLARGFGDDILKVSGTIGVGACKPFNGKKMVHLDSVARRTERIVSQGAVRTICEIEDDDWRTPDGRLVRMRTRYTLFARHRDVQVDVFFSEPVAGMCTGVQRIGAGDFRTASNEKGSLVTSWGTDWPVNDTIKYAKETLGLAVFVPAAQVAKLTTDPRNNLILLRPATHLRYYMTVVSLKENNPPARTPDAFFLFAKTWADSLQ